MRFLCMNQQRFGVDLSFCLPLLLHLSSENDNQSESFSGCRRTRRHPFASQTEELRLLIVRRILSDRQGIPFCSFPLRSTIKIN